MFTMFTVEELLKKCCPELKVLNSNADLTRGVFSADITETPDISNYINDNTLVITTGMAFKDNPEQLAAFITDLNSKHGSALAIKLERFIYELPPIVLETADMLHFPVLLIPKDKTLGHVSHTILSYLWNSQVETLSHAIDVQRDFSNMIMLNAPIESLLSHLSQMTNRSILFFDPFWRTDDRFKLDDVSEQTISTAINTIRAFYTGEPHNFQQWLFYISEPDGRYTSVSVFPVKVDNYQCYMLAVFNSSEIPYPFSELVLEQAATSLAFVLYKAQTISVNELRAKEQFFHLICSAEDDPEIFPFRISAYNSWYGLEKTKFFQVIVAGVDCLNSYPEPQQVFRLAYDWLEIQIPLSFPGSVVFPISKYMHYAIVLQQQPESIFSLLNNISDEFAMLFSFHLSYAIGNEVEGLDTIWFSYAKAEQTYTQAAKENKRQFIEQYFAKNVRDLVQFIPSIHAKHFAKYILRELAFPKSAHNKELKQTLTVYLSNQGDLTQTAKELYIHRNTVKYRIKKIELILCADIMHPEVSMNIRTALLLTE